MRNAVNVIAASALMVLMVSCAKTEQQSNEQDSARVIQETKATSEPPKKAIDVRKLAGVSPGVAEDLLGQPFDTYETDYSHPSWEPLKSIPSVSRLYSLDGLEVKLWFIEGGARWITVYFVSERPKNLVNAIQMTGLDYESPDTRGHLYAEWHGLGGFYEVRAFPHDTWEQGVSYILIITAAEYR